MPSFPALCKGKRQIIVAYFANYCFAETQYPNFGRSRNSAETNKRITEYRHNRNWADTKIRVRDVTETAPENAFCKFRRLNSNRTNIWSGFLHSFSLSLETLFSAEALSRAKPLKNLNSVDEQNHFR